jgi:hypothetical protein
VGDVTGDSGSSSPGSLTVAGSKLFFTGMTEATGVELYLYDPTYTLSSNANLRDRRRQLGGLACLLSDSSIHQ